MNPNSAPKQDETVEDVVMAGERASVDRIQAREDGAPARASAEVIAAEKAAEADRERELIAARAKLRDLNFT